MKWRRGQLQPQFIIDLYYLDKMEETYTRVIEVEIKDIKYIHMTILG